MLDSGIKTGYILSFAYGSFYSLDSIDFFSLKSSFVSESMHQNHDTVLCQLYVNLREIRQMLNRQLQRLQRIFRRGRRSPPVCRYIGTEQRLFVRQRTFYRLYCSAAGA